MPEFIANYARLLLVPPTRLLLGRVEHPLLACLPCCNLHSLSIPFVHCVILRSGIYHSMPLLLQEEEELPPSTTTGPDAKGIVTKVEYFRNEKGEVMKKTTKTRVVKIEKKVYKVRPGLDIAGLAQMPATS